MAALTMVFFVILSGSVGDTRSGGAFDFFMPVEDRMETVLDQGASKSRVTTLAKEGWDRI